jgi:hypothetical protein
MPPNRKSLSDRWATIGGPVLRAFLDQQASGFNAVLVTALLLRAHDDVAAEFDQNSPMLPGVVPSH